MGTLKLAGLAAALVMSGCVSTERGDELQKDVEANNLRVTTLEHRIEANAASPSDVDQRLDGLRRDLAQLRSDVDAIRPAVAADQAAAAQKAEVADDAAAAAHSGKPGALTDAGALRHAFDARHYKDVVSAAPRLIKAKNTGAKDELRYLYAESLFRLKRFHEAGPAFSRLLSRHPHSTYAAKALLRLGDVRLALGEKTQARTAYGQLVRKYPQTAEAGQAKSKLAKLGRTAH